MSRRPEVVACHPLMRMLGSPAVTGSPRCPTSQHEAGGRGRRRWLQLDRSAGLRARREHLPGYPDRPRCLPSALARLAAKATRSAVAGGTQAVDPRSTRGHHPHPSTTIAFSQKSVIYRHVSRQSPLFPGGQQDLRASEPDQRTRRRAATTSPRTARPLRSAADAGTALAAPVSRRREVTRFW